MSRSITQCIVVAITVLSLGTLLVPNDAFANEQDWAYIQSVGGMKLEQPKLTDVEWVLPVDIDVSGKRAITTKPTDISSARSCMGIGAEFHGNNIYLALFTGFTTIGGQWSRCPPISLGHPEPGKYNVLYNGLNEAPVKLGEITITP